MSVSVDPCASPPPGTLSCYVTTATAVAAASSFRKRRSAHSAPPRISGALRSDGVHDHDHLRGVCLVPCSGLTHGRIAIGLCWAPSGDPVDVRLGHDPVHDSRLGGRADRRACHAGFRERIGGHDLGRDNPRYRQGTCASTASRRSPGSRPALWVRAPSLRSHLRRSNSCTWCCWSSASSKQRSSGLCRKQIPRRCFFSASSR